MSGLEKTAGGQPPTAAAIVAEALWLVFRNAGPDDAVPHARAIAHWQDD